VYGGACWCLLVLAAVHDVDDDVVYDVVDDVVDDVVKLLFYRCRMTIGAFRQFSQVCHSTMTK
jgi:hypothetical protein